MDETGSTGATTLNIPLSSTYDEAETSANALISVLLSITGCSLVRQRIRYKFNAETRDVAASGSTIKHTGVFLFHTADGNPLALVEVPAILDSVFFTEGPGAGSLIDEGNSDVASFVSAVLVVPGCNPFGHEMTDLGVAYLQSRV
jgi:hypothetical protein